MNPTAIIRVAVGILCSVALIITFVGQPRVALTVLLGAWLVAIAGRADPLTRRLVAGGSLLTIVTAAALAVAVGVGSTAGVQH